MPNFCFGPRDEPMLEDHRPNVVLSEWWKCMNIIGSIQPLVLRVLPR